jgi:hypothetical protein
MNCIRFQVHSDIHLEKYPSRRLYPSSPHLILAGDIGVPLFPSYRNFFRDTSRKFDSILYVLGNHEFERTWVGIDKNNYDLLKLKFMDRKKLISEILVEFQNVTLLDNQCMMMNEKKIFGSTLWTNYYQRKSDKKLSVVERFITDQHFETLNKIDLWKSDLLITHFVSNRNVLKKKWNIGLGPRSTIHSLKTVFGHIHYPIFEEGVVCNPWGSDENHNISFIDLD